jgi:nucleoside recognition membrane protein YjiH
MQDSLAIMIKQKMLIIDTTFKVSCNHITAVVVENQDFTNLLYVRFMYLHEVCMNIIIITYITNKIKIERNTHILQGCMFWKKH